MITLQEACKIYLSNYPDRIIDGLLETPEEWIISGADKRSGLELDLSPTLILKETGEMQAFFPPKHSIKLKNAVKLLTPSKDFRIAYSSFLANLDYTLKGIKQHEQ